MGGPTLRNSNIEFFRAQADKARADAEEATLAHVVERCRRSEAAWSALADRAQRGERVRDEDARRKEEAGLSS